MKLSTSRKNINGTPRYLVRKNPNDFPSILFGITPSNSYQERRIPYQDDYSPSPKKKSTKHRNSSKNISPEIPLGRHGVLTQPISSSSRKRMANSGQSRITDP